MPNLDIFASNGAMLVDGSARLYLPEGSTLDPLEKENCLAAIQLKQGAGTLSFGENPLKGSDGLFNSWRCACLLDFGRAGLSDNLLSLSSLLEEVLQRKVLDLKSEHGSLASVRIPISESELEWAYADVHRLRGHAEDVEIGVRVKLVFDLKNTAHRKPDQPDCEGARLEVTIHLASKSPIIGPQHFMRHASPSATSFDLKRGDTIAPPPRSKNWDDIITVSTRPVSFSALRFSPTPQRNQENYPNTIYHFSENETHVRSISEVRQASNGALGPADKARTELVISGIGYKRLAEMLNEGTRTSLALKGNGLSLIHI